MVTECLEAKDQQSTNVRWGLDDIFCSIVLVGHVQAAHRPVNFARSSNPLMQLLDLTAQPSLPKTALRRGQERQEPTKMSAD